MRAVIVALLVKSTSKQNADPLINQPTTRASHDGSHIHLQAAWLMWKLRRGIVIIVWSQQRLYEERAPSPSHFIIMFTKLLWISCGVYLRRNTPMGREIQGSEGILPLMGLIDRMLLSKRRLVGGGTNG